MAEQAVRCDAVVGALPRRQLVVVRAVVVGS
jgi:hypothetical protein